MASRLLKAPLIRTAAGHFINLKIILLPDVSYGHTPEWGVKKFIDVHQAVLAQML
jgi:hypothetical protein